MNPEHLAWVTPKQNSAPERRSRNYGDFCKRNHEYTQDNTSWFLSRGVKARRCKACAREISRRWQARKRGGDPGEFAPRLDSEPRKQPAPRTHCRRGHEFTAKHTYLRPDGRGRECKICSGRV